MHLWIQCTLIRVFRAQCSFDSSPGLFAVFHALHRLLAPRHPPHALSSLTALFPSSCPCRLASTRSEGKNCASLPSEADPSEDISNDPFLRLVHYQRTLSFAVCTTNELLLDATSYHHQVVKDRLDPRQRTYPRGLIRRRFFIPTPTIDRFGPILAGVAIL